MEVRYMCGEECVNKHGITKRYGIENPFKEFIPLVGDIIELGYREFNDRTSEGMVEYMVVSRKFSAVETWNNSYSKQSCIVTVERI